MTQTLPLQSSNGQNLRGRKSRGQNLVELALTFPILLAVILGVVEIGRVWQTYEGAKLAAMDGAYTASVYQDLTVGRNQLNTRLAEARLQAIGSDIRAVNTPNGGLVGYQALVSVNFRPLFGGLALPSLAGPITLIPASFVINYQNVHYNTVY